MREGSRGEDTVDVVHKRSMSRSHDGSLVCQGCGVGGSPAGDAEASEVGPRGSTSPRNSSSESYWNFDLSETIFCSSHHVRRCCQGGRPSAQEQVSRAWLIYLNQSHHHLSKLRTDCSKPSAISKITVSPPNRQRHSPEYRAYSRLADSKSHEPFIELPAVTSGRVELLVTMRRTAQVCT